MENAGGKGGVGLSLGQHVGDIVYIARASRSYDGDAKHGAQSGERVAGIARARAVMIHGGEHDFACTPLLHLLCPTEKLQLRET